MCTHDGQAVLRRLPDGGRGAQRGKAQRERTGSERPCDGESAARGGATPKSRGVAMVLSLFLGGFGAHQFYLGSPGLGLFYILFSWTFIPMLFALGECVVYATMSDETFHAKYG